ncbi:MAG: helicase-related protein [Nitrospiraceae bacterium]
MAPSIHPVDLLAALRLKHLTPAIVFLTSRRACDEAMHELSYSQDSLPEAQRTRILEVLDRVTTEFPSIADHPLRQVVLQTGVAAHHAGHLPSWKIAIEELMRHGCLDAVFATTTLAAGVDFPARTVVITQSSVRKTRDFTDLTVSEIQQLSGRAGRRGKDLVGFAVITPSPYIDLDHLAKGLTGKPEAIDSQFVISYPMVLNLLKAHPFDHIQPILAKSFAQFQLNQRAEKLQQKLDAAEAQMEPYGPRVCTDWISQWQQFDIARRRRPHHTHAPTVDDPELSARLQFLTPGRVVGLGKTRATVLRQYRSRGQRNPMVTILRADGAITEAQAESVTQVYEQTYDIVEARGYPWATNMSLQAAMEGMQELPVHPRILPILVREDAAMPETLVAQALDEFPCPSCPSRSACQKDHPNAVKLRDEIGRHTKAIQALRTSLWHRFQDKVDVLQKLGYLTPTSQLTADGEWARLIRIDHSLLITELIRAEAFTGIEPALLAGVLASIAIDDDRPGSFPRASSGLSSVLSQVRRVAHDLAPHEDPPLLRSDIAALTERWVGDPTLTWIGLCRTTTMAEGDIYRLLARTMEYLSQVDSLRATHPSLGETASKAMDNLRRGVLEELP